MFDGAWVQELLGWVSAHPGWAIALVFVIAFTESIFLLGLVVPGAFLLFGFGALVAAGGMDFTATLTAAVVGSALGDNLSYWLGRWLRDDLKQLRFLQKYMGLIQRGEAFFQRHGGKSIVMGRMIGALRPVMPTVAGAAGMTPLSFLIIDALVMLPWVALYMLPGMLFGASMNLASEIATNLFLLLLVVGGALWLLLWLGRRAFLYLSRHAEGLTYRLLDWSQHHRRLGLLGPNLVDPALPETPALALLGTLLFALAWLVSALLWRAEPPGPVTLDVFVYQLFQQLHSPWSDTLALVLAQLGAWQVYLPLALTLLLVLLARRDHLPAAHWAAALAFGALLAFGLDLIAATPEPVEFYGTANRTLAGGHLIFSTVIYGFLAILLATGKSAAKRWLYYVGAISVITLIGLARLYIGAQWFSDTLLALAVGALWVAGLTLGYRRHLRTPLRTLPLMSVALLVFVLSVSYQLQHQLAAERAIYLPPRIVAVTTLDDWEDEDYARLPAYRVDLAESRRYPLNLQWRAPLAEIRAQLLAAGWRDQTEFQFKQSLQWFNDEAQLDELALLPQVHAGWPQALAMSLGINDRDQWVLRLWDARSRTEDGPLWVGSIARYRVQDSFGLFQLPRLAGEFDAGAALLSALLPRSELVQHPAARASTRWSGRILLLDPGWEAPD
ncbi:MAG: VTT domain-containing protein [Nevskiales bacterium]